MSLTITKHSETFSSCAQITAEDVSEIAQLGFKTIINNRPDNEGGADQPTSDSIQAAAEKFGIAYIHIPVTPGNITPENVGTCTRFLAGAPTPILGFCRTGMRASSLHQKALNNNVSGASVAKQNWLMAKLSYFFKNKCIITKLIRKINYKSS